MSGKNPLINGSLEEFAGRREADIEDYENYYD